MIVGICKVSLYAQWVKTLKEKRMIIKSIISKIKNKFNVSISEVECQDIHEKIVIGFTCISNEVSHADSIIDNVLNFIEWNTEAEIIDIERQLF